MKRLVLILALLSVFTICNGDDIIIDGDFSDWTDKPSINAPENIQSEEDTTDATQENAVTEQTVPDVTAPPQASAELSAPSAETAVQPAAEPTDSQLSTFSDMPTIESSEEQSMQNNSNENSENGPKYKISQLKWMLSENTDVLYLMVRLSHGKYADSTEIRTEVITDYGEYNVITTYDTKDATVFSTVSDTSITSNDGKCSEINKQTVYLEYGIPIGELIKDMKWGYMMKIKVHTEDDTEPKKDYIIISTAGTGPIVGAVICLAFAGAGYYLKRRKKT